MKHLILQKYTQVFIVNLTENIHVEIYKITTVRIMNTHEQVGNITKAALPGSRVLFKIIDMKPVSCKNHLVLLYIGNHSYLGNKGTGMELIQVKHEVNHLKTHIFWSLLNDAFQRSYRYWQVLSLFCKPRQIR